MTKIIKALIEKSFPQSNVEAILEVINATPKPEIAAEVLCGLYEAPIIEKRAVSLSGYGPCIFISYDKWTDEVKFSYIHKKTKGGYFSKDIDPATITMDNFKELALNRNGDDTIWLEILTGETTVRTSTKLLEYWN